VIRKRFEKSFLATALNDMELQIGALGSSDSPGDGHGDGASLEEVVVDGSPSDTGTKVLTRGKFVEKLVKRFESKSPGAKGGPRSKGKGVGNGRVVNAGDGIGSSKAASAGGGGGGGGGSAINAGDGVGKAASNTGVGARKKM